MACLVAESNQIDIFCFVALSVYFTIASIVILCVQRVGVLFNRFRGGSRYLTVSFRRLIGTDCHVWVEDVITSSIIFFTEVVRSKDTKAPELLYTFYLHQTRYTTTICTTRKRAIAKALHLEGRTTSLQTFWVFRVCLVWKYCFRTFCEVPPTTATWSHAHHAYFSTRSRAK